MTITLPNLGKQLPEVEQTDGPTWAELINQILIALDSHDHTSENPGGGELSLNIQGDQLVINEDAAEAGTDWKLTLARNTSATENLTFTFPPTAGTTGEVLTVAADGTTEWSTSNGFTNPMTTTGDMIFRSASNVADRLPIGTNGQVLTVSSGVPVWANSTNSLSGLNDTDIGSLSSGQLLIYDGSNSWDNKTISGDITINSSGVTAIASGVIVNADVSGTAAIAYSKLNLSNSITNADISSSANVSLSKLASLTGNRAVITSSSGELTTSATVTDTEIGYLSGVTSSIQTQLNGKLTNVVDDTTPQLGGNLDVNGNDIVSVSAGNIVIQPDTTGRTNIYNSTLPDITSADFLDTDISGNIQGQTAGSLSEATSSVLTITGANTLLSNTTIEVAQASSGTSGYLSSTDWSTFNSKLSDLVDDITPQLGGDLDVNGNDIISASNGDITIQPDGTGRTNIHSSTLPDITSADYLDTDVSGNLQGQTAGSLTETASSILTITGSSTLLGNTTIQVAKADNLTDGYLSSADWSTFNSKLDNVVEDTTPQLGGDLDANGNNIVLAAGAAATPSLYFTGDTNTGLFQTSADQINVTVAGTERLKITSDAISVLNELKIPDGALADPSFNFINSNATGIYSSAMNVMELIANGGKQITVSTSGVTISDAFTLPTSDGTNGQVLTTDGTGTVTWSSAGSGTGDVNGPASSTDNAIVRFDGTSGDTIQDSSVIIDDTDGITGVSSLEIAGGLEASPSLYFSGDTNTGIWSSGADTVNISTGGTERLEIDSTDIVSSVPIRVPNGTAAAPSITFSSDADTGLFSSGANAIGISTNGAEKLQIDADGKLTATSSATGSHVQQALFDNSSTTTDSFRLDFLGPRNTGDTAYESSIALRGYSDRISVGTLKRASALQANNDAESGVSHDFFISNAATTAGSDIRFYVNNQYTNPQMTLRFRSGPTYDLSFTNATISNTDGSASTPAYSFVNDTDTGMYRIGANNLGIAVGGSNVLNINSDGITVPSQYEIRSTNGTDIVIGDLSNSSVWNGLYVSGPNNGTGGGLRVGARSTTNTTSAYTHIGYSTNDNRAKLGTSDGSDGATVAMEFTTGGAVWLPNLTSTDPIATNANGEIVAGTSDARLKDNVSSYNKGLSDLMNLNPVSFTWKQSMKPEGTKDIGFLAQDVEKIIPEAVGTRDQFDLEDCRTFNSDKLIPVLVNAIKELKQEIEELKNK